MNTVAGESRTDILNDAAMRLVAGGVAEAADVRRRILPLSTDASEPAWVREALCTAIDILDNLEGEADDGAITRVGSLLELAMQHTDASASPAPDTEPSDAARALFPEFVAESLDYFEQVERALLQLERSPADADAVNVVFRAFHTIKSSASFLGLQPIASLAHSAESLLSRVRDGVVPFDTTCADLTLHCADMLRELLVQSRSVIEGGSFVIPAGYAPLMQRLVDIERQVGARQPEARVHSRRSDDRAREGADGSMRVRTERLDTLVNLVGELVVAHSMLAQDPAVAQDPHGTLARKVSHSGKIVRELQDLGMRLRMVPLGPVCQRMQRLARDVARDSGKLVEFVATGVDTEIDRNMVDFITDPLVHMIRNAIDHGIETPAERVAAGKPETGMLRLAASHEAGDVVVVLRDDGRGLDADRIFSSAVRQGIVDGARELSRAETLDLIFTPGLSTAATVTELSGRGVGMDVVRRNVESLRGRVEISSVTGAGTTFTLRLPLTLAIADGMLVRVGGERYIVPTTAIHTSFRPAASALTAIAGVGDIVMLHGSPLPVVRMHELFGIDGAQADPARALLVVIGHGERRAALLVDELLGQQQFVVKPVGDALGAIRGVAGAAILGDGSVGLILDPGAIVPRREITI